MTVRALGYGFWRRVMPHVNGACAPLAARLSRGPAPAVSAYCVARTKNAHTVRRLVDGLPAGSVAHLHQLDAGDAGPVADLVRSTGPGLRMPLLNALMAAHPPRPGDWVMVFDDDVAWVGQAGRALLTVARAGELDIAQPAHAPGSHATFLVNRFEAGSLARLSRFVEVGPVVVFSPAAQARVLPFPAEAGMGWGVDVWWSTMGLRLGVVDAAPIRHLGPVGGAYSNEAEAQAAQGMLDAAGVASAHDLDSPVGITWRPWQKRPRWA